MNFLIGFIICVSMALLNVPFVLEEGGSVAALMSLIFCSACALWCLVMGAATIRR